MGEIRLNVMFFAELCLYLGYIILINIWDMGPGLRKTREDWILLLN